MRIFRPRWGFNLDTFRERGQINVGRWIGDGGGQEDVDERDVIGERGEAIFRVLITRRHPVDGFLFGSPRFLGEKNRTVDFLVELFHDAPVTPFLFVQVRSTRAGYTGDGRLKVKVSGSHIERLVAYPAPTYIVGIDEARERGYLLSAPRNGGLRVLHDVHRPSPGTRDPGNAPGRSAIVLAHHRPLGLPVALRRFQVEARVIRDLDRFIGERAENLAIVHLTRRSDLLVGRTSTRGEGLDLLVTIRKDGAATGRLLGVQVKGRAEATGRGKVPRVRLTPAEARRVQGVAFPVCAFLFTMEEDDGYYRWVREPVVGSNRQPGLTAADAGWAPLTDEALGRIVSAVDAWYDARRHRAA